MDLSQEQKNKVAQWVRDGESLSNIQTRIAEEFGVTMTYMDVRFLVDDLDLELKDTDTGPAKAGADASGADISGAANGADTDAKGGKVTDFPGAEPNAPGEPELVGGDAAGGPGGAVSVSVDKVQRPGAVLSGSVTFSDGVSAGWQIDQFGQIGVIPPESKKDYKPTAEDIQQFQQVLQQELQKQGF
jgi:hypothetical protein